MYQRIYEHLIYPVYHWAMRDGANGAIRELSSNQALSPAALQQVAADKLTSLLRHAASNVPYYRNAFREARLSPEDASDPECLRRLPLLGKSDINRNIDDMISADLAGNGLDRNSTSGSTGEVLRFYTDWRSGAYRKASVLRNKRWLGIQPGDKEVRLWGSPLDLAKSRSLRGRMHTVMTRERLLSADRLDERTLESYRDFCRAFRPKLLVAYPSALRQFADFCAASQSKIPSLKAIICSAETLFEHDREAIEQALDTRIFDRYGCREVGDIAQEAPGVDGLLISSDRIHVEILDEDGNECEPGVQGEVVVTDLDNYGMPLIRYRIGDYATRAPAFATKESKYPFPVLASVDGRTLDVVRTPTGHRVGGTYWTLLLRSQPGFLRFQVVQTEPDLVRVLYVPEPGETPTFDYFRKEIAATCGEALRVEFVEVDQLHQEPGTKFRLVLSQLP
jgi:phenylacetate-CoA ligase